MSKIDNFDIKNNFRHKIKDIVKALKYISYAHSVFQTCIVFNISYKVYFWGFSKLPGVVGTRQWWEFIKENKKVR